MIAFFHDLQAGRVGRTLLSDSATPALLGVIVGAVVVLIMHLLPFGKKGHSGSPEIHAQEGKS